MKKLIFVLLVTSASANAWLLLTSSPVVAPPAADATPRRPDTALAPFAPDPVLVMLPQLDTADLATVRDQLRAVGVDEPSIRGLVEGALRRRHRAEFSAWQIERWRTSGWRGTTARGAAPPSLRTKVHEPLRELMGRDPFDSADAEARYDFLPLEKRRLLAAIDVDYTELRARVPRTGRTAAATPTELDEQNLLKAERRKDVLAALSPEERVEYDLRFGGAAAFNARRFSAMDVTESEFRAIKPLIDNYREKLQALPSDSRLNGTRAELDQRTMDQLVAAVGYDRAVDYVWTDDGGPHRSTRALLRELDLPAHNAARLLQLAAETGVRATAFHYDGALTAAEKRAALGALQREIRPQVDALVPPSAQSKLPASAIAWLAALSDGRYERRPALLQGSGYSSMAPVSIDAPAQGAPPSLVLVRRPVP